MTPQYKPKDYTLALMLMIVGFAVLVTWACQHLHPQFNPHF